MADESPRDDAHDGIEVVVMPKWSARQVLPDWFEITFSHPRHGAQRHLLSRTAAAALAAHLANELATPYGGAHSTPPKDSAAWN